MKTLVTFLVAGSLALNLALVGLLFMGRETAPAAPLSSTAPVKAAPTAAPVTDAHTWDNLRADDLPAMVQRLRDSGFPPEVIRAIMAAQLREAFAAREKALDPDAENRPFWKNYSIDPRVQQARTQLYREQQKTLRTLLGADADPRESVNALYQGRRFDSVPPGKLDDVQRVLRDFEDARSDAFANFTGGMITPDMQKRLTALEKQNQEALAQILTPQELEDYNLRNSDTSRQLRGNLSAFNPTEDEFRSIYKLQAEFDGRFGRYYNNPSPEEQRQRSDAQRQLNEQIKAVLGPVRGADYERATDYSYRQTSQLVARLELPPETVNQIWATKKEIEERAMAVRRDQSLAPDERTKQLAALAQEATTKISPLLGTRGFEPYKQYGGYWIQSLTPRPPRK